MDIAKLNDRKLPCVVKYANESIKIEYRPGAEARAFEQALQEVGNMTEAEQSELTDGGRMKMIEAICCVMVSWDVEMDGKNVKIDPKTMDELPLPSAFFSAIANKIGESLSDGGKAR